MSIKNISLSINYRKIDLKELKEEYRRLLSDSEIQIENPKSLDFITNKHHRKIYNDYKSWVSNTSKGNKTNFEQLINIFKEVRNTEEINLKQFTNSPQEEFELVNLKKIYDKINHFSFDVKDIKKANAILGKNIYEKDFHKNRGKFKKNETTVSQIMFNDNTVYNVSFCEPKDVKSEMKKLLSFVKSKAKSNLSFKEIFVLAVIFLVEFNRIHPFEVGNGRVSKIFFEKIFEKNEILPLILFDREGKERFKSVLHSSEFLSEDTKMKHRYKKLVLDFYELYKPKTKKAKDTFDELLERTN